MNEKLSEFKIKIGREVSQSTEITTELNKLNVKLEQLRGFVSDTSAGTTIYEVIKRHIQSTIWLSQLLNEDLIKLKKDIIEDIANKEK
jgi:hypothetical protein